MWLRWPWAGWELGAGGWEACAVAADSSRTPPRPPVTAPRRSGYMPPGLAGLLVSR